MNAPAHIPQSGLPVGTETEDWRILSARIAWIFWLTDRRAEFPANPEQEKMLWNQQAPEFRAYVRKTLRNLESEGIRLRKD
ncbi:hypothetical protein [Neptunicoccus cionae]|uniref:Uncharacterized protein n=1 Tax=Neptunicoccus cionae TaxID=2035344 RepID=A0A916VSP1_9RHOB|nr:hypothetical protein [Amylibacter cionae]GGA29388.1 hypothetical protein GCM10011498_33200 [Amylibacter cionae]